MKDITGEQLGGLLFSIRQHEDIGEGNHYIPGDIIYREKDLLPILKALGLPEPIFEKNLALKRFFEIEKEREQIDSLKELHYQCALMVKNKDWTRLLNLMKRFLFEEEVDVNKIKTILIATAPHRNDEYIGVRWHQLSKLLNDTLLNNKTKQDENRM